MAGLTTRTKRVLWVVGLYLATIVVFWFLGAREIMGKATAFFGLVSLTLVYAAIAYLVIEKILKKE